MYNLFHNLKVVTFYIIFGLLILIGVDAVSNFEVYFGFKSVLSLVVLSFIFHMISDAHRPLSEMEQLRNISSSLKNNKSAQLDLFGFKWNSLFSH
jgi:hypothetical protein